MDIDRLYIFYLSWGYYDGFNDLDRGRNLFRYVRSFLRGVFNVKPQRGEISS